MREILERGGKAREIDKTERKRERGEIKRIKARCAHESIERLVT